MLKLTDEQIKNIAGELDLGFKCYIHKKSLEVISLPHESNYPDMDLKDWNDDLNKVKGNIKQYIEIEPLESKESFNIMADFTDHLEEGEIKSLLISALNSKNPFSKFKLVIDNSGTFRQQWFEFKNARLQDWVRKQISINA